jgi:hypothetical protein
MVPKVATITKFFSVISKEEQLAQWQRSQTQLGERLKEQAAHREKAEKARLVAKRLVGRPKKSTAVPSAILIPVQASRQQPAAQNGGEQGDVATAEETGVDASEKPPPAKKKRGSYTNWFVPDLWPFIEQAVKQHPKSLYEALFSLQHIRKSGQVGSPFDNLTISTLKGWFEKDVTGHFVLRRKYEEAIKLQFTRSATQDKGPRGILKDHPVAFQMIVDTLKGMRDSGQPLDNTVAQTIIQGIISAIAPELFERHTKIGFFSVSRRFARKFVRKHMGWTWKRSTTAGSLLPADWESQVMIWPTE